MRVFIAGPYGDHNPKQAIAENVARADYTARGLMAKGHQVYCSHKMSHGWEDDTRISRYQCLELDRSFLKLWAEAVIRIPGYSPGAESEVKYAQELGIPVYYGIEEIPCQ